MVLEFLATSASGSALRNPDFAGRKPLRDDGGWCRVFDGLLQSRLKILHRKVADLVSRRVHVGDVAGQYGVPGLAEIHHFLEHGNRRRIEQVRDHFTRLSRIKIQTHLHINQYF